MTRVVALFVVMFICLNAGGAVCVAYCQSFVQAAEREHSADQKLSHHCDKAVNQSGGSKAIDRPEGEVDCCPFTVSVVASPVVSNQIAIDSPTALYVHVTPLLPVFVADYRPSFAGLAYRGPPLDHRVDRLKHCIIRI